MEARRLLGVGDGGTGVAQISSMLGTGAPKPPPARVVSTGDSDGQDALLQRLVTALEGRKSPAMSAD
eukprot:1195062-Amphidinium_carterae.1